MEIDFFILTSVKLQLCLDQFDNLIIYCWAMFSNKTWMPFTNNKALNWLWEVSYEAWTHQFGLMEHKHFYNNNNFEFDTDYLIGNEHANVA